MATQTVQQLPPQYIQDIITRSGTGLFSQLDKALGTQYQSYGGQRTADFSDDQLRAFDLARGNVGRSTSYQQQAQGNLNQAQNLLGQGTQAGLSGIAAAQGLNTEARDYGMNNLSTAQQYTQQAAQGPTAQGLAAFQDPYQEQVIDATLRDLSRQHQIGQASRDAGAVSAGAFGGSRQGVQEAESYRNLADISAQTSANLRSQGYSQALSGFQNQQQQLASAGSQLSQQAIAGSDLINRQGQAAGQYGLSQAQLYGGQASGLQSLAGAQQQLGAYGQQATAADIALLTQTGGQQQGQVQSGLDAQYQEFLARQAYEDPFRRVGFYSDIIQGTPSGQTQITNTPDPSTLSQLAGAGIAAAGLYQAFN